MAESHRYLLTVRVAQGAGHPSERTEKDKGEQQG